MFDGRVSAVSPVEAQCVALQLRGRRIRVQGVENGIVAGIMDTFGGQQRLKDALGDGGQVR